MTQSNASVLFPLVLPDIKLTEALAGDMLGDETCLTPDQLKASPLAPALAHAWAHSSYLKGLIRDNPERLALLLTEGPRAVVDRALAGVRALDLDGVELDDAMAALRQAKADVALAAAIADIGGQWALEDVTGALSDVAAVTTDAAIRLAVRETSGVASSDGFVALALGKLGSGELNYSSDIDLILLFDPERLTCRNRDDVDTAAVRIAQRLVHILTLRTGDGYVFRVDLRLRPDPDVTPPALPVRGAESYYQSSALPWERSAFVRARAIAGDIALGHAFLDSIRPFIWRRSLDYTIVRDIRDMSLHIREHFEQSEIRLEGYDVKRGRGGIREVEFFVQIHQMIHGGRDPSLQLRPTLQALAALVAAGKVAPRDAAQLEAAYRFQRAVEHRLQMVDDAQTHRIPTSAAAVRHIARFCGFKSARELATMIRRHGNAVARLYDRLVEPVAAQTAMVPADPDALATWAMNEGLPASDAVPAIERWRSDRYRALRSERARDLLEAMLPAIARALARTDDPRATLLRFDDFLSGLPSGVQILSLFQTNPRLLDLVARLLSVAPPVADALRRSPELLDVVLVPDHANVFQDRVAMETALSRRLARFQTLEEKLDEARRWTAEYQFLLAVQLLDRALAPSDARRLYTLIADIVIGRLVPAVIEDFSAKHGHIDNGALVVLALGRYGSANLTIGSDLDLVFLFAGDQDATSDGRLPLPAVQYFNRLAQRVVTAISAQTAGGSLYEVDTRLRPSGQQGLLAVTIDSFLAYQRQEAWTWEHMALAPARVVYGPADVATRLLGEIETIIRGTRDLRKLKSDVLEMRAEMDTHLPARTAWDVKRRPGGLVDLEFIAQYLTLREAAAGTLPALGSPAAILAALGPAGVLPAEDADTLVEAYETLSAIQTVIRVAFASPPESAEIPPGMRSILARTAGKANLRAVETLLTTTCNQVIALWPAVFGGKRPKQSKDKS